MEETKRDIWFISFKDLDSNLYGNGTILLKKDVDLIKINVIIKRIIEKEYKIKNTILLCINKIGEEK